MELTLLGILFALLFDDHARQSLPPQPNPTLEQAQEASNRVHTGVWLHLADTDSANAMSGANCWTYNFLGTSHTSALMLGPSRTSSPGLVLPSSNRARRNKPQSSNAQVAQSPSATGAAPASMNANAAVGLRRILWRNRPLHRPFESR